MLGGKNVHDSKSIDPDFSSEYIHYDSILLLRCLQALDIIGKAVFNYEFGSVTKESPVIEAVYSTLKEVQYTIRKIHFFRHFISSLLQSCITITTSG